MNIKIRLGDGLERAYLMKRRALAVNPVAWVQSYGVYVADFHRANRHLPPSNSQAPPRRGKVIQVQIISRLFAGELIDKSVCRMINEFAN